MNAKLDLVFVLDSSTSVTEPNFKLVLDFLKDFLDYADVDNGNVRVGVVLYSTKVQVEFHMNAYSTKSELMTAIDNIPYVYGSTNTAGGLRAMREEMFTAQTGDRSDVPNVAIVLTDGVSNINARQTIPEAEEARKAGIKIYAIGIGIAETRELDGMASHPIEQNRFIVQDFKELQTLKEKVFTSVCPGRSYANRCPRHHVT